MAYRETGDTETCKRLIGSSIARNKVSGSHRTKGKMLEDFGMALQADILLSQASRAVHHYLTEGGTLDEAKALLRALFPNE